MTSYCTSMHNPVSYVLANPAVKQAKNRRKLGKMMSDDVTGPRNSCRSLLKLHMLAMLFQDRDHEFDQSESKEVF